MKTLFVVLSITLAAYFPHTPIPGPNAKPRVEYVYICDSKASYAYHSDRNCRGLERCKHGIIRTTKDSAINYYNRRPCKYCY